MAEKNINKTVSYAPSQDDGLVVIDVQNDFLPGGNLAVPQGNAVIPKLNSYIAIFHQAMLPVFVTRDWHPSDHSSFNAQGGLWPPHCVAGTPGAMFAPNLYLPSEIIIISKGFLQGQDGYSGFEATNLKQQLQKHNIKRLYIGGLATDYCVLNTVKGAIAEGYAVFLLTDAIRAVNMHEDDENNAITEMVQLGALPVTLRNVI